MAFPVSTRTSSFRDSYTVQPRGVKLYIPSRTVSDEVAATLIGSIDTNNNGILELDEFAKASPAAAKAVHSALVAKAFRATEYTFVDRLFGEPSVETCLAAANDVAPFLDKPELFGTVGTAVPREGTNYSVAPEGIWNVSIAKGTTGFTYEPNRPAISNFKHALEQMVSLTRLQKEAYVASGGWNPHGRAFPTPMDIVTLTVGPLVRAAAKAERSIRGATSDWEVGQEEAAKLVALYESAPVEDRPALRALVAEELDGKRHGFGSIIDETKVVYTADFSPEALTLLQELASRKD